MPSPLVRTSTLTNSFQRLSNLRVTMLLISLAVALTLSPIIVLGDIAPIPDAFDVCRDETLILNIRTSISFGRDSIISPLLRCVQIRGGNIVIENGTFDTVPDLLYLDLQRNRISAQDLFSFGSLPNVRILNLGYQGNTYRNSLIINGRYPELLYLNLQYANIYGISSKWHDPFPKLTHVDLSGNSFDSANLQVLPNTLMHLNLTGNGISRLSLTEFTNLISLILDNNMFSAVGEWNNLDVNGLQKLQNLSLANNQITSFHPIDVTNLRYLNLARNSLSTINFNTTLQSLPLLEVLVLDQNSFQVVPAMSLNITTLSLNCNRIEYLEYNSFLRLSNLRKLFLNGNNIMHIYDGAFQNLTKLEELHLADNQLQYLPINWSQSMKKLRYLDLSGNKFNSLNSIIYSADQPIEQLYLERNPILYLNSNIFEIIPNRTTIYLNIGSESTKIPCARFAPHVLTAQGPTEMSPWWSNATVSRQPLMSIQGNNTT